MYMLGSSKCVTLYCAIISLIRRYYRCKPFGLVIGDGKFIGKLVNVVIIAFLLNFALTGYCWEIMY